jgi:predicted transcriptional regulator
MCDVDVVLRTLADGRRRATLSVVCERESLGLRALAEAVADRVDEDVDEVHRSLHHEHVPMLEGAGLVRREGGRVVATDRTEETLSRAREAVAGTL